MPSAVQFHRYNLDRMRLASTALVRVLAGRSGWSLRAMAGKEPVRRRFALILG